jgi:hypothetical protein
MSRVSGFEMVGPLAPFASGFGAELVRFGYRPRPAGEQLRLMVDASEWLAGHGLQPCDLTEVRVAELWWRGVLRDARICCRCGRWFRCWGICVAWGSCRWRSQRRR